MSQKATLGWLTGIAAAILFMTIGLWLRQSYDKERTALRQLPKREIWPELKKDPSFNSAEYKRKQAWNATLSKKDTFASEPEHTYDPRSKTPPDAFRAQVGFPLLDKDANPIVVNNSKVQYWPLKDDDRYPTNYLFLRYSVDKTFADGVTVKEAVTEAMSLQPDPLDAREDERWSFRIGPYTYYVIWHNKDGMSYRVR